LPGCGYGVQCYHQNPKQWLEFHHETAAEASQAEAKQDGEARDELASHSLSATDDDGALAIFLNDASDLPETVTGTSEPTSVATLATTTAHVAPRPDSGSADSFAFNYSAAKRQRKARPSAALWKRAVLTNEFQRRIRLKIGSRTFPLRPEQATELVRWADGSWDTDWLQVRNGVPACFVAQDGKKMPLQIDYDIPPNEQLITPIRNK